MSKRLRATAKAAFVTAGVAVALPAEAEQLNYAFGYPAASTVGIAAEDYAATVEAESGGDVSVRNFAMSLLSLAEAGPGLRDGLADIAYVVTALSPQDYPRYMLMQDMQMMINLREPTGKESLAYAGAVTEYTLTQCPECLDEFAEQNQVYMGGATSSINMALCTRPVKTAEDMDGLKVRISHAVVGRLFEEFGATPISFPANESYEALSQGVVDCTQLSLPELTNMSLADVVTHVTTDIPGGVSSNVSVGNINREVWQSLDDGQRQALLRGGSQLAADISWGYYSDALKNVDVAAENEIELIEADPQLLEEVRAFARDDLPPTIESYKENYGVEDADTIAEEFEKVYVKWLDLVQPVETREDFRELFWGELFSKVDSSTYGM
ncbi:MAG: C4-dicarboxylate TRAP transporter substrate-binding protein [Pseudomonadota bacterium]